MACMNVCSMCVCIHYGSNPTLALFQSNLWFSIKSTDFVLALALDAETPLCAFIQSLEDELLHSGYFRGDDCFQNRFRNGWLRELHHKIVKTLRK